MNKFFVGIEEAKSPDEIQLATCGKIFFNGKEYSCESEFINDYVLVLRFNDNNYFLTIDEGNEKNVYEVNLESRIYAVVCKSELELMIDNMSNGKSDEKLKKEIHSPMPGIIRKLNVSEGQRVKKDEVLLVLEAMKMENEIKALTDCTVKKVRVEELKSVEKNELLIEMV